MGRKYYDNRDPRIVRVVITSYELAGGRHHYARLERTLDEIDYACKWLIPKPRRRVNSRIGKYDTASQAEAAAKKEFARNPEFAGAEFLIAVDGDLDPAKILCAPDSFPIDTANELWQTWEDELGWEGDHSVVTPIAEAWNALLIRALQK